MKFHQRNFSDDWNFWNFNHHWNFWNFDWNFWNFCDEISSFRNFVMKFHQWNFVMKFHHWNFWNFIISEISWWNFWNFWNFFSVKKCLPYSKPFIQKYGIYHSSRVFIILEWLNHSQTRMHEWYAWFILWSTHCTKLLQRFPTKGRDCSSRGEPLTHHQLSSNGIFDN